MEVIVVDDASSDQTDKIAETALSKTRLNGKILRNLERVGLNASLNRAIEAASNDLICITDSDVTLEKNSLRKVIAVLERMNDVGGVTGNIVPSFAHHNTVAGMEEDYRRFSNRSMLVESYRHSAFPGSGVLLVFKRSKLSNLIPVEYGSTDANLAMSIIKGGGRFIYVPFADVYERMPDKLEQHRLQKVRRAKRLIQVVNHNIDVLFDRKYGDFGKVVFPLKFFMLELCPLLLLVGAFSLFAHVLLSQNFFVYGLSTIVLISAGVAVKSSKRFSDLFFGFIIHQLYCVVGLFSSFRKGTFWKKIDRK